MAAWRTTTTGLVLHLRVTPKAASARIGRIKTDAAGKDYLAVSVCAVPDKGKANEAVIKLLAKFLGLPKSALVLVSGATDRTKAIAIEGDADALSLLLVAHCDKSEG
ncbi:MAG: DUF167 family protein [Parvibaculaceae bacterium]